MAKGEVIIVKDLKIIRIEDKNSFNFFKFECLFCLYYKQRVETIGDHFIYLNKKKEYHCCKRNNKK